MANVGLIRYRGISTDSIELQQERMSYSNRFGTLYFYLYMYLGAIGHVTLAGGLRRVVLRRSGANACRGGTVCLWGIGIDLDRDLV